jgi:hypothetical protein
MRELLSALAAGGYSRDRLYRDGESHYILVRYWKSEEARRQAFGRSTGAALLGATVARDQDREGL